MEQHPNAAIVRRGYTAFSQGDMETMREVLAPDCVWHAPGENRLAGDHEGVDAVLALFGGLAEATQGTLSLELHDIVANDEHVVGIATATASVDGQKSTWKTVNIFHVADGRATEVWGLADDQATVDRIIGSA